MTQVVEHNTSHADPSSGQSDWSFAEALTCNLSVDLPLPNISLKDLLVLHVGSLVNTHWMLGNDVPLRVNGQLLAWCEFEIVDGKLAVRVTELA